MRTEQTDPTPAEREGVVIFLDSLDDTGSARAKLESVRGRRVALVVPPRTEALRRGIAVRLLKRMADGFAIDLTLISSDGEIERLARDEEVRFFGSVRAFRAYAERARDESTTSSSGSDLFDRATRLIIAAGGLVAMILVVATIVLVLIPSATVTLRPATEPIGETIELRVDPEARSIDYVARRVPGRAIYEKVEGTDQVPATGAGQSADARALGRVTFKNRVGQEVVVPEGTIVTTADGVKFVVLPSDRLIALAPARGAWAQADIRAVDPGPKGNVPRGAISRIEGPLSQQLDVLNEEPTATVMPGGLGTVTQSDQKRLYDQLYERLSKEALAKLQAAVRQGETVNPNTVRLVVLDQNYDRRIGDQAKALNLRMEVRVNATAFDVKDVNGLAERAWQPQLRAGFAIVPDSILLLPPEVSRVDGDVLVLRVRLDATAAARINEEQVIEVVRLRNPNEAVNELARLFILADRPQVVVDPSWARRAFRVRVAFAN